MHLLFATAPPALACARLAVAWLLAVGLGACPDPPAGGPEVAGFEVGAEVDATAGPEIDGDSLAPEDPDIEVAVSECAPGAADQACDDGNRCTDDLCRPNGTCAHTPNIALCDDADACTSFDRCSGGACIGVPFDCDDGSVCTEDRCERGACSHIPFSGRPCDDASLCTIGDHCDDGACVGTAVTCPGGGPCGTATCEPRTGCGFIPLDDGAPCDDGNACTSDSVCAAGVCRGHLVSCADDDPCTDDFCDPAMGCSFRPNRAACDDLDRCTVDDRCAAGVCAGLAVDDCCVADASCDDGDACTDDRCAGPACVSTPRDCDDGDRCTRDGCELGQCTHTAWLPLPEQGQVFEDFEGTLGAWMIESDNEAVTWRLDRSWAASGEASLYCGDAEVAGYDHGATRASASTRLLVPPAEPSLHLVVRADVAERGSCIYDALSVRVDSVLIGVICGSGEAEHTLSLAAFEGREVAIELIFDTVDDVNNVGQGLWIDRLSVTASACD